MSVLVKGMEMPKNCRVCQMATRFFDGEDVCALLGTYVSDNSRDDDCPLVELPPHGDLIDRDEIVTVHEMVNGEWKTYVEVFEIENAPTIIEAEPTQSNALNALDNADVR